MKYGPLTRLWRVQLRVSDADLAEGGLPDLGSPFGGFRETDSFRSHVNAEHMDSREGLNQGMSQDLDQALRSSSSAQHLLTPVHVGVSQYRPSPGYSAGFVPQVVCEPADQHMMQMSQPDQRRTQVQPCVSEPFPVHSDGYELPGRWVNQNNMLAIHQQQQAPQHAQQQYQQQVIQQVSSQFHFQNQQVVQQQAGQQMQTQQAPFALPSAWGAQHAQHGSFAQNDRTLHAVRAGRASTLPPPAVQISASQPFLDANHPHPGFEQSLPTYEQPLSPFDQPMCSSSPSASIASFDTPLTDSSGGGSGGGVSLVPSPGKRRSVSSRRLVRPHHPICSARVID